MSRGLPSPNLGSPFKKDDSNKPPAPGSNALWRIPEWFPHLTPGVLTGLKNYHAELLKFNARLNLISKNTEREADEQHFADCIRAVEIILKQNPPAKIYDIGSGNGLPGLVFAIMDPSREYSLVESDSRKGEFLKHVIDTLKMPNVKIVVARFESLKSLGITCAVSRGFASISKTVLTCNKLFDVGSKFYHLKGSGWSSEVADIPSQLISVWSPELVGEYVLPVSQARRAVVGTQKK